MKKNILTNKISIILLLQIILIFLLQFETYSQNQIIKGIVVDSTTQKALRSAHIFIKETSIGTISNSSGLFRLVIPEQFQNNSICIQFLGYKTYEFLPQIKKKDFFTILLTPATFSLNQIEIIPLDPKKIILRSIDSIKVKFQTNPFISQIYYKEQITNNNKIVQQYEVVFDAYIEQIKKKRKVNSKFLKGRYFVDTNNIEYNIGFSGSSLLKYDPIFDFNTAVSVFNKHNFKKYKFSISDISKSDDVIIISYEPIDKYKNKVSSGEIYIDKKSYFPIRHDRDYTKLNKGKKLRMYKDCYSAKVLLRYSTQTYFLHTNKYYLGHLSMIDQYKKQCTKDGQFEIFEHKTDIIATKIQTENVIEIPKEQQVKKGRLDKLIMEECDSDYWEDYNIIEYEHSNLYKNNVDSLIYPTN